MHRNVAKMNEELGVEMFKVKQLPHPNNFIYKIELDTELFMQDSNNF